MTLKFLILNSVIFSLFLGPDSVIVLKCSLLSLFHFWKRGLVVLALNPRPHTCTAFQFLELVSGPLLYFVIH